MIDLVPLALTRLIDSGGLRSISLGLGTIAIIVSSVVDLVNIDDIRW